MDFLADIMLRHIFDPNEDLVEEFHRRKGHFNYMADQLEEIQRAIWEAEDLVDVREEQLESWLSQLDEWENQRRTAVVVGQAYLEEIHDLWEQRNVWLVQNGLEPIEGGL